MKYTKAKNIFQSNKTRQELTLPKAIFEN